MTDDPRQTDFIVQLRSQGSVDAIYAMKQLLKIASRRFGLRCISVTEVKPADGTAHFAQPKKGKKG